MSQVLKLEINSQLTNTAMMAMALRGVCALTSLPPRDVNRMELCLVEIVNNAIEHAYGGESGHSVEVVVCLDSDGLQIAVSDWGDCMSDSIVVSDSSPDITDLGDPQLLLSHGRGLSIVNQLMDQTFYQSEGKKNTFVMRKKL